MPWNFSAMSDEDWITLHNQQTIAASVMLGVGLIGITINLSGVFLSFRVRALRSPFGRLMAVHCFSDAAILSIFTFWCATRTYLGFLDHDSLLSRKVGQVSLFFWFTSIYSQLVIALNRCTLLMFPNIYNKIFARHTHLVILSYWGICLLHACIYFGDGCDFYYNSEVFHWQFADTPCGQTVGFWLDFIFGCTICCVVLFLDFLCLIIMKKNNRIIAGAMQSEEISRRSRREAQFMIQACCTGVLFTLMLFSFHYLSRIVTGVWAVAATTTLMWELAHLGDGIILFAFNNELRKVIYRPRLLFGMTTISSKALEQTTKDSVVLCDGYARLKSPKYASTADGRFIFVLGNMQTTSVQDESLEELERITSFQLDIIDLFLSNRIRMNDVGPFYNFGHPIGFYALNERAVVIVDYERIDSTFRQRLIQIDVGKEMAECVFYRGYDIVMESYAFAETSTGDEYAVTLNPELFGSRYSGVVYPLNPLSSKVHKDITTLIDQANGHVRQFYEVGERAGKHVYPPFILHSSLRVRSGTFYIQEAKRTSSFPLSADKLRPTYAQWCQTTDREVMLRCRYRRNDRSWQVGVAWLLLHIVKYSVYAAIYLWLCNCHRLGGFCLRASRRMIMLRSELLDPKTDKFYGRVWLIFGTLNTRTLEWSEIKATMWNEDETTLVPLRDGNLIVASMTRKVAGDRVIGMNALATQKMERFRLIGNPLKMPSLTRLSSVAVQRNGRVPRELLEQIASRMLA
ncbi:hypothetical protein PRIPAC_87184 [Pristionchus pacificus]|uniref:G protein-coupled receptor n=1 Tax=Pristionchus pacificus TaxID=54126 RepID=A0A2A6B7H9_PRIPA|nr:hypothetical protein PRIPAC_87184 [Pristionchus pacificus]|eukprot:PDM61821.1 G protein-coupled receptor [Pristionchus pacificus]